MRSRTSLTTACQAQRPADEGDPPCPSCGRGTLSTFFAVENIPVHSCLLVDSRAEALAFPQGELALGLCRECGFIANTRFDPAWRDYGRKYEETQGFSQRFNTFLVALVKRLIDRYDIRRKQVLEIGCGKGDFLALLCELGDNRGVGIDPACVPERLAEAADRIQVIVDYYDERYAHVTGDVICCRHTLEHIPDVGNFLRLVRRSIGRRKNVLVFFEVPETFRILREGAFWDVYYEHTSYFTAGSLARLFRACGFDIDELYLDYGNQYVLLTARPSGGSAAALEIEDDLAPLVRAVAQFRLTAAKSMRTWRELIRDRAARGDRGVLWGSGSKGAAFLTTLKLQDEIEHVVDINPYRQGKFMPMTAQRIIAPDELADYRPDYVLVMNPIYWQEVRQSLRQLGIKPDLLTV